MSGRTAPPKPWERQDGGASTSSVTPLGPSSAGDATRKPWEGAAAGMAATTSNALVNRSRPWQSGALGGGTYGNYGSTYGGSPTNGGGMYGSSYGSAYGGGGLGSAYGGSAYGGGYGGYGGGSTFGRPMGGYGGAYGGGYGSANGSSMYGGVYGSGLGSAGMYGQPYRAMSPYGGIAPGAPYGGPEGPPAPPSAWQAMLHTIGGVVHFFGRLSFLVDENAHAVHFFVQALLQLLDRAGSLYGELARFVLRLLGYKGPPKAAPGEGAAGGGTPGGPPGPVQLPGAPTLPGAPARGALPGALAVAAAQPHPRPAGLLPGAPARDGAGASAAPSFDSVWGKGG